MQNKLRKDYDSESWSLISTIVPSTVGCKLCPTSDDKTEETFRIENGKGAWVCKSILDPYPLTHPSMFKLEGADKLFQSYNAHGWSEVIIETRDHVKELHELTSEEIKNVLLVYVNRIKELKEREKVEQICIFKDNLRLEFDHSYSKLITLPIVPKKMGEKLEKFNDFRFKHDECLYCNLIQKRQLGSRMIFENDHFICLAPFSQQLAYEIYILPKKHYSCLSELNEFEIFTLSETIKNILIRLNAAIKPFKYGMAFYIKPINEKDFHFHIQLCHKTLHPTLKEGYGVNLNKITPEDTAKILRG